MIPTRGRLLVRTAFNLDFWQNKNVAGLLEAVERLTPEFPQLKLEVAGGGSTCSTAKIEELIRQHSLANQIALVGPVRSESIQRWFNGASVFALPSHRESFGMVFAEALLAGTPVIYPRGAAIEGFFKDCAYALGVIANDPDDIANALRRLLVDEIAVKANLETAQRAGQLNHFKRKNVLESYTAFLRQSLI
jgi:glycosyltransferase involved in cell wall biosynthesis